MGNGAQNGMAVNAEPGGEVDTRGQPLSSIDHAGADLLRKGIADLSPDADPSICHVDSSDFVSDSPCRSKLGLSNGRH